MIPSKKRHFSVRILFFATTALCFSASQLLAAVDLLSGDSKDAVENFPLVKNGKAATIVISADAPRVIQIAAADLASDVERVTGVRPQVINTKASTPISGPRLRIGIASTPNLNGRWEAFELSTSKSDEQPMLNIAGSDARGVAYGIYEISRRIGVSPWYWWADVPVVHRDTLLLSAGTEPVDKPAVKYRGIFLNDEGWGLNPWASKTFEPEVGNIGPKTYARIFELMLRLRANTIWPAMHPCTTPFFKVPENAAIADEYAIVLGSSHAEPMLRNNVGEWTAPKEDYNYIKNPSGVLTYWEDRVKERTSGESLYTLGMRGIHDSAIVGPKNQAERIATVEQVIADQRNLFAKYLGKGDPTKVGQIFVPYKEVLEDYNAGLKVPEDVALVWPDDNFGYIRRYGTPTEQARSGGLGVYYHLSYLGAPLAWLWVDTLPPALVWSEMTRAYEQGANKFWIANVGDIKNNERSTEFFLDLAWHADRTSPEAASNFLKTASSRDFGPSSADAIASILARLQSLATARRAEHLQWFVPKKPYKPTGLNVTEINTRLDAFAALVRDSQAVAAKLPPNAQDAYFELIGYPVEISAAANERYFREELARVAISNGASPDTERAAASKANQLAADLTARYNEKVAGGKWRGIVTDNGVSTKEWKTFQPDTTTPRPSATAETVAPPAPPEREELQPPADAKPGDFLEFSRVISINAGNFSTKTDIPNGGWRSITGLGRTGSAVTVLPSTAKISAASAPSLSYRFHVATGGSAKLIVRLLPTHPIVAGKNGLRLAVAIDSGAPIPLAVTSGFEPKSDAWNERVLSSATEISTQLPGQLTPGWHTLHLVAVDAGVVVDKLVIDFGGLTPSYDGPAETRVK